MYSHKDKLKDLFVYLPKQYQKEVCKELNIELVPASKQKIWRVKKGIAQDHNIEACLIKIAKREKRLVLKNKAALEKID